MAAATGIEAIVPIGWRGGGLGDRMPSKLAEHRELRGVVEDKLADWWSPQQVARWLRRTYLENQEMAARYQHRLQGKVVGADESSTEREPKGRAGAER